MTESKDLFDESTMSFGEHLEILRVHLWKALIGLVICVGGALFVGKPIMGFISRPVERALKYYGYAELEEKQGGDSAAEDDESGKPKNFVELLEWFWFTDDDDEALTAEDDPESSGPEDDVIPDDAPGAVALRRMSERVQRLESRIDTLIDRLQITEDRQNQAVTLSVQEAFMTYLKVSFVAGLVVASPWVIYQLWLFVAAGLYPHERSYVYVFLPVSTGLFLTGIVFCFFIVFPFVLVFLLSFNDWLELNPNIRMTEWISFAISMPLMFGLSFQLPLVMLFLERISVFEADDYRQKRRMAVLVIAVLSMMLTPADPTSMIAMMVPLLVLYELGIIMCRWKKKDANPYEDD